MAERNGYLCPVLVGRGPELAVLDAALARAERGEGSVVLVTGEAGIGKTRLVSEAQRRARDRGVTVMGGGCAQADLQLPYLPFLEAIGDYLAGEAGKETVRRLGDAGRVLALLFPSVEPLRPVVAQDCGADDGWHLFEAVTTTLRLASDAAGLLLVLEDLHWADLSTRQLLVYLVRRLADTRILLVATCRDEELVPERPLHRLVGDLSRRCSLVHVDLGPLGSVEVRQMARQVLGTRRGDEAFAMLCERGGGNPFLLEELLRGETVSRAPLVDTTVPDAIRRSISVRIGCLGVAASRALAAASVLGTVVDTSVLAAMLRIGQELAERWLAECVSMRLLDVDGLTVGRYRFAHELAREAVYDSVSPRDRTLLHSRAAYALQRAGAPAVDVVVQLRAAGRLRDAVPFCIQAGDEAQRAYAFGEAARLYELALEQQHDAAQRGQLLGKLGIARTANGEAAAALPPLDEAVRLVTSCGDLPAAARYRLMLGFCRAEGGRPDLAVAEYEQARDSLKPAGPSVELAEAYRRLAINHITRLEAGLAVATGHRAREVAEATGHQDKLLSARVTIGIGDALGGRAAQGIELLEDSYLESVRLGHHSIAAAAMYYAVWASLLAGRAALARQQVRRLGKANAGGWYARAALMFEGLVHLWGLGEPATALDRIEQAIQLADDDQTYLVASAQAHIAVALGQLGQIKRGRQVLALGTMPLQPAELFYHHWATIRLSLDDHDLDAALAASRLAASATTDSALVHVFLTDIVVESLVAAGELAEATRLVRDLAHTGGPFTARCRARVHLAAGEPAAAQAELEHATRHWMLEGCQFEESRTRLLVAEALDQLGDIAATERELRRVLASAAQRGALLDQDRARHLLDRLGIATRATVADVRATLEDIHRPDRLAANTLVNLRRLDSRNCPAGVALRDLLLSVIDDLTASPAPQDAVAGALLRQYYVERVGSQEMVAERLHLSRSTFYRRLHAAWTAVADRLGDLDLVGPANRTATRQDTRPIPGR